MKNSRVANNISLIVEVIAIIVLVIILYLINGDAWLFLLGGLIIIITISFSIYERRKYEKELEIVAEYIDEIFSGKTVDSNKPISDDMSSKLGHQLNRLQNIVEAYKENAKRDKQEIRDLIVEIAHQLRMPIANLDSYLDLIKDYNPNKDEYEEYMDAIEISKSKLIFLVESFIKMSRLESNVIQIRKESTDINETINSEITNVNAYALKKGINISFIDNPDISVSHDKNWLGEAIFNLLDNSVKYSFKDSEINIILVNNEMFTEIQIIDEGPSISLEEETLIFKRFYRGNNSKNEEGFGLGLYLSREIILRHDGFIKFKNLENGHSFSIFLPK